MAKKSTKRAAKPPATKGWLVFHEYFRGVNTMRQWYVVGCPTAETAESAVRVHIGDDGKATITAKRELAPEEIQSHRLKAQDVKAFGRPKQNVENGF